MLKCNRFNSLSATNFHRQRCAKTGYRFEILRQEKILRHNVQRWHRSKKDDMSILYTVYTNLKNGIIMMRWYTVIYDEDTHYAIVNQSKKHLLFVRVPENMYVRLIFHKRNSNGNPWGKIELLLLFIYVSNLATVTVKTRKDKLFDRNQINYVFCNILNQFTD